jgi:glucose-1-phosphate cytidylyltransferase
MIKEYFANYALHRSDVTFDFKTGETAYFNRAAEPWRVTLVDTGLDAMTGGRLRRARAAIGGEAFMLTYGDGVADIDLRALLAFHRRHGKAATVTAVQPPGRFGVLDVADDGAVTSFREKPGNEIGWINGGFFVLEPSVFDLIEGDATVWEREPLERLAARGDLAPYRPRGYWQPVDTLRAKRALEALWAGGTAPWRVWD